jgi:hypothetical protein
MPQGYSVVLVLADLAASTAQDDVPPAARRALTDMKDFLPFKSYRLLDAAWILGQGSGRTVTILRGVDEQELELRLEAAPHEQSRVYVRFALTDVTERESPLSQLSTAGDKRDETERTRAQAELMQLNLRLLELRRTRQESHPEVRELGARIAELKREVEQPRPATRTPKGFHARAVVDTNFTMDIGETVVVGTSRLRGGSRALIALLTAVPPKGVRPETR